MKRYPALVLFSLFTAIATAQIKTTASDTTVYLKVDVSASYPGGLHAFSKFIGDHLLYPDKDKADVKGLLNISFVVEKNGTITDCKILKGFSPAINTAIISTTLATKWNPAKVRGVTVRQQYFVSMNYEAGETATNNDARATTPASYPGGIDQFYNYLNANLKYPAKAKGLQGTISASFIIEPDGLLSDLKIEKSLSPEIDAEVLRVIKTSKKWHPGKQNGRAIRQKFTVTIPVQV